MQPDTARTFHDWLRAGRYVRKAEQPIAYRWSTLEPLYAQRQTEPLTTAPPNAAPANESEGSDDDHHRIRPRNM